MVIIPVKSAKRLIMRNMENSLRKDILSYLAELVTNADDSYKRLEESGENIGEGNIFITVTPKGKKNYEVSVIDFAEGMSYDAIKEKFSVYGNDNAGGVEKHVRGIFGQGLSDVLRNASRDGKTAMIESIKDGMYTKMLYIVDEDDEDTVGISIDLQPSIRANDLLREKLGIKKNGTKVTFGVPSGVSFGSKGEKGLRTSIEKCPTFRYLLDDDLGKKRKVYLGQNIWSSKASGPLSSYKYRMQGDVLCDKPISFPYKGNLVHGHLTIYKKVNEDDEAKIIIRNEDYTVFDDTSFGARYFQDFVGELVIDGLYEICYNALNDKKNPEAILNDNRTGFNTKKEFYINMEKYVYPEITGVIDSKETSSITVSNKEFKEGLSKLNEYINKELKEEKIGGNVPGNEPPDTIKFARGEISITEGKKYGLRVFINSGKIKSNDKINITVENNDGYIGVSPLSFNYDESEISDTGLVIKNITIDAIKENKGAEKALSITASCGDYQDITFVTVTKDEIHEPEQGLEFYPDDVEFVFDVQHHKLELYFDTEIISLGSTIKIDCGGLIGETVYEITDKHMINSKIGKLEVVVSGGELGKKYVITATCGNNEAKANITLVDAKEHKESKGKLSINGVELTDKIDPWLQVFYDPRDGKIYVNKSKHLINQKFFGNYKSLTNDSNKWNPEQRRYICDLVTNCAAQQLVNKKGGFKKNEINIAGTLEDISHDVWDAVQKYKNEMFDIFYKYLFNGPNSR